jgi:hypothetical protein
MITEKDSSAAGDALIDWFKSQGLDPADGSLVMLKLMAAQLVSKTKNVHELERAIGNVKLILTCEIAIALKANV